MKKNIFLVLALVGFINVNAQITFNDNCPTGVLGVQDYVLNLIGTTNDGGVIRNTYESTVVDFTQSCPLGNCEVRIIWDVIEDRWEIEVDNGNDGPADIPNPNYNLMPLPVYFNTAPSEPNPPSMLLGTWIDPNGFCGGLLNGGATLLGDVQDTPLGIDDVALLNKQITMSPNPASDELIIKSSIHTLENVEIYSLLGSKIKTITSNFNKISVTDLASNMYLVKIVTTDGAVLNKKLLVN